MSDSHKGISLSEEQKRHMRESAHRGSEHHLAKLVEKQVLQIKKRLLAGEVQKHLAEEYRVTPTTVLNIQTGKTWRHVLPGVVIPPGSVLGSRHWRSVLTELDVKCIKQELKKGSSKASLAKAYGVNFMTVSDIAKGRTWSHVKG
jgi:DNA-binding XRE family transcriptional regulator